MSFFEPPPPPPAPPETGHRRPDWLGPPANVLPGLVPVELLVARTDEAAVAVSGIRAYPNGFGFLVSVRLRRAAAGQELDPFPFDGPFDGDRLADTFLRFGVQFADGAKATNLRLRVAGPPDRRGPRGAGRRPDPPGGRTGHAPVADG
jgi:hypothetical protein